METILIQNFKAIKNTAKREIKVANLTILMGEQATGKSTVAKLVYFFKKLPEIIWTEILTNKEINEENFDNIIFTSINLSFTLLFGDLKSVDKFSITYIYTNGFQVDVEKGESIIYWPNNESCFGLKEKLSHIGMKLHQLRENYTTPDITASDVIELHRLSKMIINIVNTKFNNIQNILYVPASRNISVSFESHLLDIFSNIQNSMYISNSKLSSENDFIVIEFLRYIQRIKKRFKSGSFQNMITEEITSKNISNIFEEIIEQITNIFRGEYRFEDNFSERILLHDGKVIDLSSSSSGQQEIIRILQDIFLVVLDNEKVFRVYEEIESHLSPVGQLGVIQIVVMLVNRNPDNQIVIPTHTPYLLREVSNMMKASKIVKDNPDLKEEVSKILKSFYWLDMQSVSAYQLTREGEIEDAKDEEYQMIDGEIFDKVTNEISDQLDKLLSLQYE